MRALIGVICLLVMSVSARAEDIELVSGEVLTGRIAQRSAELIRLDHPILGMLDIPVNAVRTIGGKPLAAAEPQVKEPAGETPPPDAAQSPAPEVGETKPPATWQSQIELGLNGRRATTEDLNFRVSFLTTRARLGHQFRYDATYRLATARGDRSQNNFTTGMFSEWDAAATRFNAFVQGRYDYDEFQSWDQRITSSGGLGYRLFDVKGIDASGKPFDRFRLLTRLGGGVRREFGSLNDDIAPEGLLGTEATYRMNGHMTLSGASTLFPDLKESGEFRLVSRLDWTVDIDEMKGISLKVGLAHEYDSQTAPGIDPHDLSAYAALLVKF